MIHFLRYRVLGAVLFIGLIAAFVAGVMIKGFTYSVDFTGGTQILFSFSRNVSDTELLTALSQGGFTSATTRAFSDNETLIRLPQTQDDIQVVSENVQNTLLKNLPDTAITIQQVDNVGPSVGDELWINSIKAIILALLLVVLYITARFWEFSYAMGSVVSLLHDVLVILTFVVWFDFEISLPIITAILFVLGYSINDTIVIFSKIRENRQRMPGKPLEETVELSINQTLRRTLLTSIATSLVVVALLLFGGPILQSLSIAIMIGMVFGTYSSIFIASPVMLLFHPKRS